MTYNSQDIDRQLIIKQDLLIFGQITNVFPLLCPVIEYKWINGWKCKLIHFPNGKVEKDCVFCEIMTAPFLMGNIAGKTKWTVILFDPINNKIHFRLDNKLSTSYLKIELNHNEIDKTECFMEFNYKPITKKGDRFINQGGETKIRFFISALGAMLKTYCESGEMLSSKGSARLAVYLKNLTRTEKLILILNKLIMHLSLDMNKKGFFAGDTIIKISKS
jgi:hypothetical protein